MRNFILTCFLLVLASACNLEKKYPGFSRGKDGIYYQLHRFTDSHRKPAIGDFVTVDLVYMTLNDSAFFKGRRKFQLVKPKHKGSVNQCFLMMTEGDSATFIIPADIFFSKTLEMNRPPFIGEEERMKISISMREVQTAHEYEKEKEAFLHWIEDFDDYEKVLLKQYLEEERIDVSPNNSGLRMITLREGNGKKIRKKDTIIVHYEGRFLNGKYFDSTKKRKEPFSFVYGQQWQVIEGLEEAFGLMEEGEKAIAILPSNLAWGEIGSATGIIPPYTSLVFELEVLEVLKGQ